MARIDTKPCSQFGVTEVLTHNDTCFRTNEGRVYSYMPQGLTVGVEAYQRAMRERGLDTEWGRTKYLIAHDYRMVTEDLRGISFGDFARRFRNLLSQPVAA